jgi:hypothetical protein
MSHPVGLTRNLQGLCLVHLESAQRTDLHHCRICHTTYLLFWITSNSECSATLVEKPCANKIHCASHLLRIVHPGFTLVLLNNCNHNELKFTLEKAEAKQMQFSNKSNFPNQSKSAWGLYCRTAKTHRILPIRSSQMWKVEWLEMFWGII